MTHPSQSFERPVHEAVPLQSVPADTLYQADSFIIKPVPPGTTVIKGYDASEPATEWIDTARVLDVVATQRNSRHHRSFELTWDEKPDNVDVTLKGANWSNPGVMYAFRLRDVQYMGGLQYEDAEAALQAGERLEAAGIYGERIVRIDAPQALPLDNELRPPHEVIGEIVEPYMFMRGKLKDLFSRDSHRPVVAMREAPTDIRLWDFQSDTPSSQLYAYLEEGMQRAGEVDVAFAGMDPLELRDAEAFFMNVLPQLYGIQMGKLEASGLRQEYPHPGNIAIDGGLIDLDGIQPTHKGRMYRYANYFVAGVKQAQEVLASHGMAPSPSKSHDLKVFDEFSRAFKQGKRQVV